MGVRNEKKFPGTSITDQNLQEVLDVGIGDRELEKYRCEKGKACLSVGPLLIQSGVIQSMIYQDVFYLSKPYARAVLIETSTNNYIYISISPVSLPQITETIFEKRGDTIISAVNLHGDSVDKFCKQGNMNRI